MTLRNSSSTMHQLEDVGTVFRSRHPEDRFIWSIPNCFPFYHNDANEFTEETPRIICSPCFFAFCTKWRLALIRNNYDNFDFEEHNMGLFIWKIPTESSFSSPELTVKMGLIATDFADVFIEGDINSYGCYGKWHFQNREEFLENSVNYTVDGYLRYFCQMRPKAGTIFESPLTNAEDMETPTPKGIEKLAEDLKSMLSKGENSDVAFRVGGREFKVHRNILTVRSPLLAALTQNDTKESTTNIVDVPNCSAEVFQALLTYIYTGRTDNLSFDNIFDLYSVANNYQIIDLKTECVEFMERNLTTENFCDIMTFSLKHSELDLQKTATNFFRENADIIIKTDQWQEYLANNPAQANDLYIKAINA